MDEHKHRESREIEEQVKQFLAAGNKITKLKYGETTDPILKKVYDQRNQQDHRKL